MHDTKKMYPKVKVRYELDPIAVEDRGIDADIKIFDLSLEDRCPPGCESLGTSSPLFAKVPGSYVPTAVTPLVVHKGHQSKDGIEQNSSSAVLKPLNEDSRLKIRASSIPRPRAVVSSPDNDEMIGNRNRLAREKLTAHKTGGLNDRKLSSPLGYTVKKGRDLKKTNTEDDIKMESTQKERTLKETDNKSKVEKQTAETIVDRLRTAPRKRDRLRRVIGA